MTTHEREGIRMGLRRAEESGDGALEELLRMAIDAQPGAEIRISRHDLESYARGFNDGYEEALAQGSWRNRILERIRRRAGR
jgi:flagellar biosynthesis/type III secretory pathway protein FliH